MQSVLVSKVIAGPAEKQSKGLQFWCPQALMVIPDDVVLPLVWQD